MYKGSCIRGICNVVSLRHGNIWRAPVKWSVFRCTEDGPPPHQRNVFLRLLIFSLRSGLLRPKVPQTESYLSLEKFTEACEKFSANFTWSYFRAAVLYTDTVILLTLFPISVHFCLRQLHTNFRVLVFYKMKLVRVIAFTLNALFLTV